MGDHRAQPLRRPGTAPARHPEGRVTTTDASRYPPAWLALRESADATARAPELLEPLRTRLATTTPKAPRLTIRDLGCGTGSMGRWLAPRLPGPQHWILHDHDPDLLVRATAHAPRVAVDGSRVTVAADHGDLDRLTADTLATTSLVTASALLDVLTRDQVERLATACADAGCPALLALSVAGRVDLTPADPLDGEITDAFNAHQRRTGLLGPDAVTTAYDAFAAHGATVRVQPSPWRLGPDDSALISEWLQGWTGAARDQRPDLAPHIDRYLMRRQEQCAAGQLRVVVHHNDLLALPRPGGA
ncbi:methyltransferase domain-containing protein [Streptomyces sp. NPDC058001]|uniref:methyltransferase domain-containing protein n=1 Tax=Streptomyces sp. NPDC058001 TaxID=3346300 RepID=UPI0036E178A9